MEIDNTLLLVCTDEQRRSTLGRELCADGCAVESAANGAEAQAKAHKRPPAVIVIGPLERPLAQLELIAASRAGSFPARGINPRVGLIALGSPAASELDCVRCLDAGADDHIPAGAGYLETRARIAALCRRLAGAFGQILRVGALEIDPERHTVTYGKTPLALTRTEFALLHKLAIEPTRLVPKHELLRDVWGYVNPARTRTADAHLSRLRRKLAAAGAKGLVVTVHGVGYRLSPVGPPPSPQPAAAAANGTGNVVELRGQRLAG